MNAGLMILGPNGSGKTKIAFELARRHGGEIINLDRTYLYRGFPVTTGLQDTLQETGVPRHLYEILPPEEKSFPAEVFSQMVAQKRQEILSRGALPIAEGGSSVYVPALLELNANQKSFRHVIGLRFAEGYDIATKYRARIDRAFDEGLAEELSANAARYEASYLIRECHFAVPTVRYLRGELSLKAAKEEILRRCLEYHDSQLGHFLNYPGVQWVEVSDFSETLRRVEEVIDSKITSLSSAARKEALFL